MKTEPLAFAGSEERHATSTANNRGYCRQRTTDEMVQELAAVG